MFVWIVWQAISVPFRLCFDSVSDGNEGTHVLDNIIDIYFALDMVIAFNTGFYKNGV